MSRDVEHYILLIDIHAENPCAETFCRAHLKSSEPRLGLIATGNDEGNTTIARIPRLIAIVLEAVRMKFQDFYP
jgi:hypothetical protein